MRGRQGVLAVLLGRRCVPSVSPGEPCGLWGECVGSRCSDEGRCLAFEAAWCA